MAVSDIVFSLERSQKEWRDLAKSDREFPSQLDRLPLWSSIAARALFACFLYYSAAHWLRSLTGLSLPGLGPAGFTLIFWGISFFHAISVLGWRRALVFFAITAVLCWTFEDVGVLTGLVYGGYHYGAELQPRLGAVPIIVPLAWFMMIYPAWVVAHILLEGTGSSRTWSGVLQRSLIGAMAMTSWDVLIDPELSRTGAWVWERGGDFFGVPIGNFAGWVLTTACVYLLTAVAFRTMKGPIARKLTSRDMAIPLMVYVIQALDLMVGTPIHELWVVNAFGMSFIGLLALMRSLGARKSTIDIP